jgi:hypothetical protein
VRRLSSAVMQPGSVQLNPCMCTGCALAAALVYVRQLAAARMRAGAPGDMQTVSLHRGGEGAAHRYSAPARAHWRRASYAWLHHRGGETVHSYSCLCTHGAIETSSSCVCACMRT